MNTIDAKLLLLTLLGAVTFGTEAQAQKQIRIGADANVANAIPMADRYRYPRFMTGTVVYRNGVSGTGQLNYNRLLGEMQFIDPKGDTMALADEQNVAHVTIGPNRFYVNPGKGCPEVIAEYGPVKLAKQVVLKSMRTEKKVAYGQSSGASSVATVQPYSNNSSVHRIGATGDQLVQEDVSFMLVDQNDRYYLMSKSAIFKVFSKHKKEIEAYLKENSTQFTEEADVRKLIKFCSDLSAG